MGRRVVVRILGVASTTRGFAFALTEGPKRLVNWGLRRRSLSRGEVVKTLTKIVETSQPLFVAFEQEASERKRKRGKRFIDMLQSACAKTGVMIRVVESKAIRAMVGVKKPTKWYVAKSVSKRFRQIQHLLPAPRKSWQGEDDRIGSFLALAAALSLWEKSVS